MIKTKEDLTKLFLGHKKVISRMRVIELDSMLPDELRTKEDTMTKSELESKDREYNQLKYKASLVDILLDSLHDNRGCRPRRLIESYYIHNRTVAETMGQLEIYSEKYFHRLKSEILTRMLEIL